MPANVPTMADFDALDARVTALEAGTQPPEPIEPPDSTGVEPKRIATLIESFGVNTFSSMDSGNSWGSWPADYQPDSVIAGLKYLLADSGHAFRIREYHYQGRESWQRPWLAQVTAAIPGSKVALCIAANGGTQDVPTMLALAADPTCNVVWVEGLNEPNTDFGWGNIPPDQTLDIQRAVNGAQCTVMGPSIVAGTPHPEGWITAYAGDTLDELNANMDWGNGHYYPPHAPDVPGTGYSVEEYVNGLALAYQHKSIALTEFHPTLYAASTMGISTPHRRWASRARVAFFAGRTPWKDLAELPRLETFSSSPRDPFYTLTTLLRCAMNGTMGVWWYALYDYGSTYECGLFPQKGADNPRPVANAIRALCAICADHGDRHGFTTSKLDITVDGLTANMDCDLYQASDGRWLVPIWYSAEDAGQGTTNIVSVRFGNSMSSIDVYDPLTGAEPVRHVANVDALHLDMQPGVLILAVQD